MTLYDTLRSLANNYTCMSAIFFSTVIKTLTPIAYRLLFPLQS
jgi:hypothetical protein